MVLEIAHCRRQPFRLKSIFLGEQIESKLRLSEITQCAERSGIVPMHGRSEPLDEGDD